MYKIPKIEVEICVSDGDGKETLRKRKTTPTRTIKPSPTKEHMAKNFAHFTVSLMKTRLFSVNFNDVAFIDSVSMFFILIPLK